MEGIINQHNFEEKKQLLKEGFPDADIEINDLAGDDNHYAAKIKSSKFKGKTRVQQHQMSIDEKQKIDELISNREKFRDEKQFVQADKIREKVLRKFRERV